MRFCANISSQSCFVIKLHRQITDWCQKQHFLFKKQQDTPNFRSAITHEEKNKSKRGKLIQMTTGYFLRWRTTYYSFPGPLHYPRWRLSQIFHPGDIQNVKFSTCVHFTKLNSNPLIPPPPAPSRGELLIGALVISVAQPFLCHADIY